MRFWLPRNGLILALALISTAAIGCTPSEIVVNHGTTVTYVSVERMAGDLGLAVVERSASHATLRNARNFVMVYPDPYGQVFVNGTKVGPTGGITSEQGEMLVPVAMVKQVRQSLLPLDVIRPMGPTVPNNPIVKLPKHVTGRVMVDAGHGGIDPGARSVLGYPEKDVTFDVAGRVAATLEASGVGVAMTRTTDVKIELDDRVAKTNAARPDLFVSVHADSSGTNPAAHGFTVYVSRNASARSLAAAQAIEGRMRQAGFTSLGVKRANYRVIADTDVPAVLVELGFVSNAAEAAMLHDSARRSQYAQAICAGVADFLGGR